LWRCLLKEIWVEMKYVAMALMGMAVGTTLATGVGCANESKVEAVIEEGANAPRANLPAVPTLPPPPFPVEYSPGVYSVYGLRHTAARNLTKQVVVKAYIAKVYTAIVPGSRPPRRCTERDRCEEPKPHVFLADRADETEHDNLMIVTGYSNFQSELDHARAAARSGRQVMIEGTQRPVPTDFDQGAQVEVTGTFTRRAANGGHADSNGLLDYISHRTITPAPSGR
jgi:hypothetical protein